MNILITNDDGVHAQGIITLARTLVKHHNVLVVAPEVEHSGCGHSITLNRPLSVKRVSYSEFEGIEAYSISGTPSDCVMLGTRELARQKVDVVLAGINLGSNVGTSIAYSGTVNAALEGCVSGYPAIALSQAIIFSDHPEYRQYYEYASWFVLQLLEKLDITSLDDYILNINFPEQQREKVAGVQVCEQGINEFDNVYKQDTAPFGEAIYWLVAEHSHTQYNEQHQTDVKWLKQGYITISPLTWRHTHSAAFPPIKCKIDELKLQF